MSSQIRQYETPFRGVADKTGKDFSVSNNIDVCSRPGDLHNPMYGVCDKMASPLQDDGKYSKLNEQHNLNICSKNGVRTATSERIWTSKKNFNGSKKKRLVCVLSNFIVIVIIAIIAAFIICLTVAFSKVRTCLVCVIIT